MQSTKWSNLTLILFFVLIFGVPVFWVIRGENPEKTSPVEFRELATFTMKDRGIWSSMYSFLRGDTPFPLEMIRSQFFARAFQSDIEQASADQLPLRIQSIKLAKFLDRQIIALAYWFLPDPAIPTDMQSGNFASSLYVMRDGSQIFFGPAAFDQEARVRLDRNITNYFQQVEANPGLNFYTYYIDRLEFSPYHPLNSYFPEADQGQSLEFFVNYKPVEINLGKLMLTSFEDSEKFFYRTDHHLNIHGIVQAYLDIHELLKKNYPQISPPLDLADFYTFENIKFLGYFARHSLYPITPDFLEVFLADLPPYKVYVNGQEFTYGHRDDYFAGSYPTAAYVNHYGEYFGGDEPFLEFISENGSDRNLLIISNSYDNALLPLIAAHYHHTYSVDAQFIPQFSLSAFTSQYPVDDYILVGDARVLFLGEWVLINP